MRSIPAPLLASLQALQSALCTLWKVQRADGLILRLTDHDQSLVVGGQTYTAAVGYSASAIKSLAGLAPSNLDIEGLLDTASITEEDLLAGRWDHAQVTVSTVDWSNPGGGSVSLRSGRLGRVETRDGKFVAEMLGLAQLFDLTLGELYQPGCRASLGDSRCQVALGPLTVTGTVDTDISDRRTLADAARTETAGYFDYGVLTWTSGANTGLGMEVKASTSGVIELQLPMPYPVAAGDAYSLTPGCDGLFDTCKNRFNNVVNFQGEPDVVGPDQLMQVGGR